MHPDSEKSGGFFNKVKLLVRGTANAAAAPRSADPDSLSAREALQEAVVRKRRNEAIRQQEFAQLRLLRQRNDAGHARPQALSAAQGPLSSLLGQETRSTETLQKIDAIEAQMSGQWWRQPASVASKAGLPLPHHVLNTRQLSDLPVLSDEFVVPPVEPKGAVAAAVSPKVPAPAARMFKPHPDLEEAAILFAHGDVQGARTRLLEQLVQSLSSTPIDEDKVGVLWHSILDWCRATGDEETFEPLAIDYAEHFGRSAPLWSSLPASLGLPPLSGAPGARAVQRQFQWASPAMLTLGAVTALRLSQQEAPQPWSMSWLRLSAIDEAALGPLTQLLDQWASSPGQFVLSDAGRLLQALAQQTPVGERLRNPQWWALRMAVLRWMDRMEAYEQVALDYCMTYEVSPPPWSAPVCHGVVQEEGEADISVLQEASRYASQLAGAAAVPLLAPCPQGLAGVIEGDPQACLDALASQAQPGQVLEVACAHLIRLDFVAAGSVLNWAAEMQSQGVSLRFTQLHQLVAVFFHVIGIQEHAAVHATQA